jgi:hypothetical protein
MSSIPSPALGCCLAVGIDINNETKVRLMLEYCQENPGVAQGDPGALQLLIEFLKSHYHSVSTVVVTPEATPAPTSVPPTHPTMQDLYNLFQQFGQQVYNVIPQTTTSSNSSIKISDPPKFSGDDRRKLRNWMVLIHLKIFTEVYSFPNEFSKVSYALSHLSDTALSHYEKDLLKIHCQNISQP